MLLKYLSNLILHLDLQYTIRGCGCILFNFYKRLFQSVLTFTARTNLPAVHVPLISVKLRTHWQMESLHSAFELKHSLVVLALHTPPRYPSVEGHRNVFLDSI